MPSSGERRMKDDKTQRLDLSDEFLLESADKRLQEGNYLGALTMLNKRNQMYAPSADAQALAADIYEAMELWPQAADAWFRLLDPCNEAGFSEGYEGLAVAYMNMGNDLQSAIYYQRAYSDEGPTPQELAGMMEERSHVPELRIVHSEGEPEPELLNEGLEYLRSGMLDEAKKTFLQIPEESSDHPSAAGLAAMCTLMSGDEEGAERECAALIERYPDNVQTLTTYCAVQGARGDREGARQTALRLASLDVTATEDLYRVATALCETGLDEQAFEKLAVLKDRLPYDENVLFFYAVAAFRTQRTDEAVAALEVFTTVYPRRAVARYYLERMRRFRDGEEDGFSMTYYYRVPEEEYRTIANFFLGILAMDEREARKLAQLPQLNEFLHIAFDEMEGRDDKLQMLAIKVADMTRADAFLREILLDCKGSEYVKLSVLHELTARDEEDSFGTVICNIYKEFFTHKLEIGPKKHAAFLNAFADVYAKFALLGDENEGKICAAAEDIYDTLDEAGALSYCDERAALAAAIYREARIKNGERSLDKIVEMFGANKYMTEEILNYMM